MQVERDGDQKLQKTIVFTYLSRQIVCMRKRSGWDERCATKAKSKPAPLYEPKTQGMWHPPRRSEETAKGARPARSLCLPPCLPPARDAAPESQNQLLRLSHPPARRQFLRTFLSRLPALRCRSRGTVACRRI